MKIKSVIISLISMAIIAITGILLYIYWPAITGTINKNSYLTPEQGQEMYDKGYEDGNKSNEEQLAQIAYYKQLTDEYYIQVGLLNDEISQLNNNIINKNATINELTNIKNINLQTISNLNETILSNEAMINSLDFEISELTYQLQILTVDNSAKSENIISLNNQVSNLTALKNQLEISNQSNIDTITILNNQIIGLNNQVSSLTTQIQNSSSNIRNLQSRINELEASVSYYEQYIASLESNDQVVVTFEYDGSVYNIQIINKNSTALVNSPASTNYIVFNGWTVNNQIINLNTYTFTTNTKVIADVTYKHEVLFKVDNETVNTQFVVDGNYLVIPSDPIKNGYEFDGWTLNGVDIVNPLSSVVTEDVVYIAKFTKLHTVTFMSDGNVYDTQIVRNGSYATAPVVNSTTYKVFNCWTLNGVIVDVSNYLITANISFVADITYKYDVVFVVNNTTYDTQIVRNGNYAILPTNPIISGYQFDGWTVDGQTVINVANAAITMNTTFIAKFSVIPYIVEYYRWNGIPNFDGHNVWTDGTDIYYSYGSDQFVLDKTTHTWSIVSWNGYSNFDGYNVWTDGTDIYYSYGFDQFQIILHQI